METTMATHFAKTGLKALAVAVVAGSLAAMTGSLAFAQTGGRNFDPAQLHERLERRVDRALKGTDATAGQKKQIADILAANINDMRPLRDQRLADRKAMQDALQAPTIDPAKVEAIRSDEMKIADQRSRLFTKALTDAGNVLNAEQRQAFFKNWNNRSSRPKRG
jgi:Spy/CpxP family protein refolding chaperone